MKKILLLLFFVPHLCSSFATTWKIGPSGNFTDINAAMSSASVKDGDVLQLMDNVTIGSSTNPQTVTKSVTIQGPGIKRDASGNIVTQSTITNIYLQGDGILLSKLHLTGNVYIRANDITIEKCLVNAEINGSQQNYDTDDFTLRQSYIQDCILRGLNSEDQQGWRIINNIFENHTTNVRCISAINGALIDHNIFYSDYANGSTPEYIIRFAEDCTITNNIFARFTIDSENSSYQGVYVRIFDNTGLTQNTVTNNVISGNTDISGNKSGITTPTDIFYWKYLSDLHYPEVLYLIPSSSLAKGYANDGGDCGPWDGQYPYLIGGTNQQPTVIPTDEFQVEPNDLLALKNMYNAFGGNNWTTKKWSFANNGKNKDDFPGVTFTDNGRVTAIDLDNNHLEGEMFDVYSPSFAELTSLNLAHNKLRGDISKFVINLPKLQTLNISYNRITEVSQGLPPSCNNVSLQFQNRPWGVSGNYVTDQFFTLPPIQFTVRINSYNYVPLPSLFTYAKADCTITTANGSLFGNYVAQMLIRNTDNYLRFYPTDNKIIYTLPQDLIAIMWQNANTVISNSAYPIKLHFAPGDADMNGLTNVLDVQYTLTYILASNTINTFNYSAANTYNDNLINVQDIVATVNIILDSASALSRSASSEVPASPEASEAIEAPLFPEGTIFARDRQLFITASRNVSAIDVELEGISTDQAGLMLPSRDFQMIGRNTEQGSRYIIFSPTGKSIPADTETPILRLAAYTQPVSIMCSDPEAKSVEVAIGSTPTGIKGIYDFSNYDLQFDGASQIENSKFVNNKCFDLQGRQLHNSKSSNCQMKKGLYIQNGKKIIFQ